MIQQRLFLLSSIAGGAASSLTGRLTGWASARSLYQRTVRYWEMLLLVAVLILATLVHATNMFHFPHYEVDEGTYVGSAWAMFKHGELSYYTYNYDHPFLGWFQIGTWATLFGGFLTFGSSVNTGRTLMLVVAILSTLLIFLIVRRATGRAVVAFPAALLFAVSPLGVSLHRQVWLDNLATLWLLVSICALLTSKGSLRRTVLSAVAFGLAFWTKEIFGVFLPVMLYLVFVQSHAVHRRFALALWGAVATAAMSLWVLFALLKDELLPPSVLWSSSQPHVSLTETLLFQASRDKSAPPGPFPELFAEWVSSDPVLLLGGSAAAMLGLLFWRKDRVLFGVSLLTLCFVLFNARGGVVLFHYVIPLLALLAVAVGLMIGYLTKLTTRWKLARYPTVLALLALTVVLGVGGVQANAKNLEGDSTSVQLEAARWLATNVPSDSVVIMDSYAWVDLREPSFTGGKSFKNAHYYWPAQLDPAIREDFLEDDWRNIDYLLISASAADNIKADTPEPMPLIKEALLNAEEVQSFENKDYTMKVFRVR